MTKHEEPKFETREEKIKLLREVLKAKYRNQPCSCGSGLKFKQCCVHNVKAEYIFLTNNANFE